MNIIQRYMLTFFLLVNVVIYPVELLGGNKSLAAVLLAFSFSLVFMFLIAFQYRNNIFKLDGGSLYFFLLAFIPHFLSLSVSFIENAPIQYAATLLRLLTCAFVLFGFYVLSKNNAISFNFFLKSTVWIVIICLIVSIKQVSAGELIFMNGAYRLSSLYGSTPAGFALLMLFCSSLLYSSLYIKDKCYSNIFVLIMFFISCAMLVMTHSRQAMLTIFFIISILTFIRAKGIYKILALLFVLALSSVFLYLVFYTDLFPRIYYMFENGFTDSSTETRIGIITDSLSHMSEEEYFWGVGMGGFNYFYYDMTGILGYAAHNDYLLYLVESGVFGLAFFCILTFSFLLFCFYKVYKYGGFYFPLLSVYIAIGVLSFINNPFYYIQVQVLAFSLYGFYLGKGVGDNETL